MSLPHTFSVIGCIMAAEPGAPPGPFITVLSPSVVNEGDTAQFTIKASNFPDGVTQLNWVVNNITSQNADFIDLSGTVNISTTNSVSADAFINVSVDTDTLADVDEQFRITVSGTVSGTAISKQSSAVTITDVEPPTLNIPAGTTIGRTEDAGILAYSVTETSEDGGRARALAAISLEVLHGSDPATPLVFRAVRGAADSSFWFNAAGTQFAIAPSPTTPPTIYENSVTPTAVRFETRSGANTTEGSPWVDGGWQDISQQQSSEVIVCRALATEDAPGGRTVQPAMVDVRVYVRADGYLDTLLGTFKLYAEATAELTGGSGIPA